MYNHLDMLDLEEMKLRLRYFDCRGRAEALRRFLNYRRIPFKDDRIAISDDFSNWKKIKPDSTETGFFHRLPVLWANDFMISEALAISHFIDKKMQPSLLLTTQLKHTMLQSFLYQDILVPLATLIWSDFALPGINLAKYYQNVLTMTEEKLHYVSNWLKQEGALVTKAPLCLTAFWLAEVLDMTLACLPRITLSPELQTFHDQLLTAAGPSASSDRTFTAKPGEREFLSRLLELQ